MKTVSDSRYQLFLLAWHIEKAPVARPLIIKINDSTNGEICQSLVEQYRYCSRVAQTATDFADVSHSKSAKSAGTTVSYGIFSSENSYLCTATKILLCNHVGWTAVKF